MKIRLIPAAALIVASLPLAAQNAQTGVSNPDPVTIDADQDGTAQPKPDARRPLAVDKPAEAPAVKPSAAKAESTGEAYGPYVPYKSANVAEAEPAKTQDVDSQIVTHVPEREGEINEGTLLRVRMREQLSTATTASGSKFTAEVMEPITHHGRVIVPIGSILEGQVTAVHAGHRISGAASLHLEPQRVTLPDGTLYIVHAQLIDTTLGNFNVDREGTLKRRDRAKETLAVTALATGSGAAAGAMIGGGVGAVVGAGVGAGVSTVMWLKQERQAVLDKDSRLVFSLTTPMMLKPLHADQGMAMNSPEGAALKGSE